MSELLDRLDAYLDLAPRSSATTESVGPFTIFVGTGLWRYYARPARDRARTITPEDVTAVRNRQRSIGEPENFEWVWELAPELPDAARAAGLAVERSPLLVLDLTEHEPESPLRSERLHAREIGDEDPALATVLAAVELGFRSGATAPATAGPRERDALLGDVDRQLGFIRRRIRDGEQILVAAEDVDAGAVAGGSANPRGDVAELVGIATIPAWRRRGAGALVTAALLEAARAAGVGLAMLSAADDGAARVYERLGFRRVGSVGEARPDG